MRYIMYTSVICFILYKFRVGKPMSLENDERIEQLYFDLLPDGSWSRNHRYMEFMEFAQANPENGEKTQDDTDDIQELKDVLELMDKSHELESLEEKTEKEVLAEIENLCLVLKFIKEKIKLEIWIPVNDTWELDVELPMDDYYNGDFTYQDLAVKIELIKKIQSSAIALLLDVRGKKEGFQLQNGHWKALSKKSLDYL